MSSIFDDDNDDFELLPGGDDNTAAQKPRPTTPVRPANPSNQAPARPEQRPAPVAPVRPSTGLPSAFANRKRGTEAPATPAPVRPAPAPQPATKPSPAPEQHSGLPVRPGGSTRPRPTPTPTPEPVEHLAPAVAIETDFDKVEDFGYSQDSHDSFGASGSQQTIVAEPHVEEWPESVTEYDEVSDYGLEPEPEPVRTPSRRTQPRQRVEPEPEYDDYEEPAPAPARRKPSPSQPSYLDLEEEFEDEMDQRVSSRKGHKESFVGKPAKAKKKAPAKKAPASASRKGKKDPDAPKKFGGGRKAVLYVRIGALTGLVALIGFGANSVFNPPYIPSKADVTNIVRADLGVTGFDTAGGSAFVTAFAEDYLTFSDGTSGDRKNIMLKYTNEALASNFSVKTSSESGSTQTVSDGPIINNVEAIDANNAIYNVSAKVNGKWMYLDIPVYFDDKAQAFAISGTPSFTPPKTVAELPKVLKEWDSDTEIANLVEPDVANFFKAWGESKLDELKRYTIADADVETMTGLQGQFAFKELASLDVQEKVEGEDTDLDTREARVTVNWVESGKNPKATYSQTYKLVLYKQPDGKWDIADISGGIRDTSS